MNMIVVVVTEVEIVAVTANTAAAEAVDYAVEVRSVVLDAVGEAEAPVLMRSPKTKLNSALLPSP